MQTIPRRIDYAGNSFSSPALETYSFIQFSTETRADPLRSFDGGALAILSKRIKNIEIFRGSRLQNRISLSYGSSPGVRFGSSVVGEIKICDGDLVCLAPLTISGAEAGLVIEKLSDKPDLDPVSGFSSSDLYPIMSGDWNGDGKTDFARVLNDGIYFFLSNGGGSFSQAHKLSGWSPDSRFYSSDVYPIFTGDWDGDGKTDFARVQNVGISFFISNGDGSFRQVYDLYGWGPNSGFSSASIYPIFTGDWNGDGKTDFARVQNAAISFFISNGDGSFRQVYDLYGWGPNSGFSSSSIYPIFTGDWNGDGKTDFARVQNAAISFFISNGDGSFSQVFNLYGWGPNSGFSSSDVYPIFTGDWNGDGKTDFARVQNAAISFFISNGDGSFTQASNLNGWSPNSGFSSSDVYPIFTGDWNGDGKTDFARVQNAAISFFISNGDGSFSQAYDVSGWGPNSGFYSSDVYPVFTGDWNGDGKTDFARVQYAATSFFVSSFKSPGLALKFAQSGVSISLSHQPLTNSNIYTRDASQAGNSYPRQDLQQPIYVVSGVVRSSGAEGANTTTYTYGGLKAEQGTGRGLLGFRWMKTRETATGIESYTEFRQDFPYIGVPLKTETRLISGSTNMLLKRTSSQFDCRATAQAGVGLLSNASTGCSAQPGKVYFPYASVTDEESWDLNGVQMPRIRTSNSYSGVNDTSGTQRQLGDPTQIQVDLFEGSSLRQRKLTSNEYAPPNTSNWTQLGRLRKASVTSTNY
jgi:hypothetical protein